MNVFFYFGMTINWPTLCDVSRSYLFWQIMTTQGPDLSKKSDLGRSPKVGQIRAIPNSKKKNIWKINWGLYTAVSILPQIRDINISLNFTALQYYKVI